MSQSKTELEQLRARCKSLEDMESQARATCESLKDSESRARAECMKAQQELDGIPFDSSFPLSSILFLDDFNSFMQTSGQRALLNFSPLAKRSRH